MILKFELTMPNRGSWNNRWSGESEGHYRFRVCRTKKEQERAMELNGKDFWHRWEDGWTACVSCEIIDSKEKNRLQKKNGGFYGYDWMCASIWNNKVDVHTDKIIHEKE